jgi:hypothetical protein
MARARHGVAAGHATHCIASQPALPARPPPAFRRALGITATQIVYVESIARTRRFSLSAKLLYHLRMADMLLVQWEALAKAYPRAVYAGRLY